MNENFHCDRYHLDMPAEKQRVFCAARHRTGFFYCGDECAIGKKAANETRKEAQASSKVVDHKLNRSTAMKRSCEIRRKGMGMGTAIKKCVDCGEEYQATSNVQKRCAKCKAAKKSAPAKKQAGRQGKVSKGNGARSTKKTGYIPSPEEEYLNSIGMTQMADELKKFRLMAQAAKQILG